MTALSLITLSDAVDFINGDRGRHYPDRNAQTPEGYCLFLNTGNVRRGQFDFSELAFIDEARHRRLGGGTLARNDIVLTIRGTLGNTAIYRGDIPFDVVRINSAMLAIRPKIGFDADFIERYLRSPDFLGWVGLNRRGSAQPHLRTTDIQTAKLPLMSLPHQKRIVTKIDSLLMNSKRARDRIDHVTKLVVRYKEAFLREALSGSLTELWRKHQQTPAPEWRSLSEVADDFSYGSAAKSSPSGKVPVLRMGNIQDGRLDWSDLVYSSDEREIQKYILRKGDVLFNRTNSPALVGKTALYEGSGEAIYAGYLIRIRCKPDLDPAFLTFSLNGPLGRSYCWSVKTDGVSQSNISAKKIAAFNLLVPTIEEQREIVCRIKTAFAWIDRLPAEAASARKLIDYLDEAVLSKAFRGKLVPQDPADEPASASLERIKAASVVTARAGRRRGRPCKAALL